MRTVILQDGGDFTEWRRLARGLLASEVRPEEVDWVCGKRTLFDAIAAETGKEPVVSRLAPGPSVPRSFIELAEAVVCHADPVRFALLYRLLYRLQEERGLLSVATDADVALARRLEKSVRRDCHKMTAFVRFREVHSSAGENRRRRFVAWFEPDHNIVGRTAPFFSRRFADMDWMILTPRGSAVFESGRLALSALRAKKPETTDPTDALWLTYYSSIFNPARLKVKAMQAEMPKKYWRNMPEAALIPSLIAGAPARVTAMAEQASLDPPPFHLRLRARRAERDENQFAAASTNTLPALREAALGCTRCPLHCHATQTVFGEGPEAADLMIVGEQPGDREDLAGRPFVGPSGQLLDEILIEAGIDRSRTYVTNAVKHFKHEPRGKRRLHKTPNTGEIERCRWWLDREIEIVRPKLVVAMGATALFALTGEKGKLADRRGRVLPFDGSEGLVVTVHPAYLLRLPDPLLRREETIRFRADFAAAGQWLAAAGEAQG